MNYSELNAEQKTVFRHWLMALLYDGEVQVKFLKKDGTERNMRCTLKPEFLPETKTNTRTRSDEAIAIWDIDLETWRSFRWDSILQVSATLENKNG